MSAIPGRRAAVFTQQSQDVEVLLEGDWRPGVLLGWRHDGGTCEVWVRVTVDGSGRETWTDLAEVRLPEARPAPGVDPSAGLAEEWLPGASAVPRLSLSEAAAREQRVAGVLSSATSATPAGPHRPRRHGGDVTAEMPAVQGGVEGRHRASGVPGRHRALEAVPEPEEAPRAELTDATVLMPRATDTDCMTRPLRFGDRVSRPRLVRPDGVLRA